RRSSQLDGLTGLYSYQWLSRFGARRCITMAERKSTKKTAQKSAKSATASGKTSKGWTAEERAAAKAYAQERKAEARGENDESAALAAIAAMPKPDRTLAERLHAIIKASAPDLSPKT